MGDMVLGFAREDRVRLALIDPDISEPFLDSLESNLSTAATQYLGFKSTDDLKAATAAFTAVQAEALTSLTLARNRFKAKFRQDPSALRSILDSLGYTELYKEAHNNRSQASLVDLLYTYETKLPTVLPQLIAKNIPLPIINAPAGFAAGLLAANITQDSFKVTSPALTGEKRTFFNNLWYQIVEVTDAGKDTYKGTDHERRYIHARLWDALGIHSGGPGDDGADGNPNSDGPPTV